MKIAIGADHGGYPVKAPMKELLESQGHTVVDLGAYSLDPADDYPDFAKAVAEYVASGQAEKGIVLCGSGVGAAVASNKVRGVRASVCHDTYSAHQGVEHDDINVLCLGAHVIGPCTIDEVVRTFAEAEFQREERYIRRLDKIKALEKRRS